jgi:hypothetical protein
MAARTTEPLSGSRKVAVLLLPWIFLGIFITLYRTFMWGHVTDGNALAICLNVFVAIVFLSFVAAAITFSRDVISGRYP